MSRWRRLLLCLGLSCSAAQAHVASNGFLNINASGQALTGSVELAVRDVELAIGADENRDGQITWGELRASAPRLTSYLEQQITLSRRGLACPMRFGVMRVTTRVDGNYAWLPFTASCPRNGELLDIRYRVLDGVDPSHRGLLTLTAGAISQTAVLGADAAPMTFSLDRAAPWRAFREYLAAGVWHIWSGFDHLLFLISLLLPAVLRRRNGRWEPIENAEPAFLNVLKVVTAFTIAHSLTLSLAAFDVVRLPSRLTESVIAASIVVAALNNIFPLVTETRARIAFAFGLLHGFGFASVLADMGLPNGARLTSLVAFNLGIEAGQLAVVLLVMPIAYGLRKDVRYQRALLPWGSAAIVVLAAVWFVQRAFFPG